MRRLRSRARAAAQAAAQALDQALDQVHATGLAEFQGDAERLRRQARSDGQLSCSGDPDDR